MGCINRLYALRGQFNILSNKMNKGIYYITSIIWMISDYSIFIQWVITTMVGMQELTKWNNLCLD